MASTAVAAPPALAADEGGWAAKAVLACRPDVKSSGPRIVGSSDGSKVVVHGRDESDTSDWYIDTEAGKIAISTDAWTCPEFLWAPDSSTLAVTYSDGGLVGGWHVGLYLVDDGEHPDSFNDFNHSVVDIAALARADFQKYFPKCYDPSEPNLGAVAWLQGSKHLLVAAEVPPDSNCNDMGTFALYEVSVPGGKIIKKYGQLDAKRLFWKLLGSELRNANDSCIRKPGSCERPGRTE